MRDGVADVDISAIYGISLFSGVGSLDIGIELACRYLGREFKPLCYVENEITAAAALVASFEDGTLPAAPVWSDVSTFDGEPFAGLAEIVFGGFPCTDISHAGDRAGLDGARSGLWVQFARIVRQVRPRLVFIENVRGMLNPIRDDDGRIIAEPPIRTVLRDLSGIGFDADWVIVSAQDCGFAHGRDRCFILAYARCRSDERRGESSILDGEGRVASGEAYQWKWSGNAAGSERVRLADTRNGLVSQPRAGSQG